MNIKELLHELKQNMDHVYLYGVRSAARNKRIMKLLPVLEKYIDEDVAYLNLHSALRELTTLGGWLNSIELLSTIHTSLNYLLRLHGEAIASGEERLEREPILNMNDMAVNRQHSFLELKPLMNALSGIGNDRIGVIRKAREENFLDDIRTYSYLNKALADEQPDVAELVEDIIRSDIGVKILPFILSHYECDDKEENVRRLELLYEFKYDGFGELCEEIWESDVANLQAWAIEHVANDVGYEDLLIEFSEKPHKLLREKAALGLARLKTEKAEKKLYELYTKAVKKKGKEDLDWIVRALSQTGLCYVFDDVLSQVRGMFNDIIVAGKKAETDLFTHLRTGISVMKQKKVPKVYDFMLEVLFNKDYNALINKKKHALANPAKMISCAFVDIIQDHPEPERAVMFCEKVIGGMEDSGWKQPFYKMLLKASIRRGDSIEQIYDVFAPYYRNGNIGVEDIAEICGVVRGSSDGVSNAIDSRWLDELYETLSRIDEEENAEVLLQVLDTLESGSSERYNRELIQAGEKTKKCLLEITSMIMKRDLPDKYETVYALVRHSHNQGASGSHALRQLLKATYWSEFPKSFAAKFRELKNVPKAISAKIEEQ